jgi:hypothetical protein
MGFDAMKAQKIRKSVTALTLEDLREHSVWEFALDEEGEPGQDETTVRPYESGALRVVPGSHAFGRLDRVRAEELRADRGETAVPMPRGGVLVMRPLILHASSKATEPMPRRVLHFVFGPPRLSLGLEWSEVG